MLCYFQLFPEKTKTELRTIHWRADDVACMIPQGTYVFTEWFCDDLSCDCRRVLIKVLWEQHPNETPRDVATINYTWNTSPDKSWRAAMEGMENPFLDPLHFQIHFAPELMALWLRMLRKDRDYEERLKRHYAEVRTHFGAGREPSRNWQQTHRAHKLLSELNKRYRERQRNKGKHLK